LIPVFGVAAVAGESGNGNIYYAERLKELHGVRVPMLWLHQGTPMKRTDTIPADKIIGYCTVYWNGQGLLYIGEVKNEFKWCVEQAKGASIGAFNHSFFPPHVVGEMTLVEVSLVTNPSIKDAEYLVTNDYVTYIKVAHAFGHKKTS